MDKKYFTSTECRSFVSAEICGRVATASVFSEWVLDDLDRAVYLLRLLHNAGKTDKNGVVEFFLRRYETEEE